MSEILSGRDAILFPGQGLSCLPDLCVGVLAVHTATSERNAVWKCSVLHGSVNAMMWPRGLAAMAVNAALMI